MLWPIFLKTYFAVAALYLVVTFGYVFWRLGQRKTASDPQAVAEGALQHRAEN